MSKSDLNKKLKEQLAEINKSLKTKFTFADEDEFVTKRISTGLFNFDQVLGGGFPRKSVTLLYGNESSGKTYVALHAIANAQKEGLTCGFIDAEFSYDPVWAEKIGVDNSNLFIIQPETGEAALDATLALCKGEVDLVIVDSIAALLPTKEFDGTMEDNSIGTQARLMNQFFRKHGPVNKSTALVMINQVRSGIGSYYVSDALPAGKGQQFFSRIIVHCKRGKPIQEKGNTMPQGFQMHFTCKKNKTAPPLGECDVPFYYSGLVDKDTMVFQLGVDAGLVERRGAYYTYGDIRGLGRENFIESVKEQGVMDNLIQQVQGVISNE